MQTDNIKVSIEATDGRPLRYYSHEGKTYLESHENREYQVRIKNQLGRRIKVVVSVDSLNIISGKPASDEPNETGYILNAYEEQVLKGYRVDRDTVAAFKFVKREGSYATEVGSGAGNGVIAVRAYEEKETEAEKQLEIIRKMIAAQPKEKEYVYIDRLYPVRPWYWEDDFYPYRRYWHGNLSCGTSTGGAIGSSLTDGHIGTQCGMGGTSAQASADGVMAFNCSNETLRGNRVVNADMVSDVKCAADVGGVLRSASFVAQVKPQSFDMGSGWGNSVKDSVKEVEFEAGKLVAEVVVYYMSRDALKAHGVDVDRVKAVAFPEPFKKTYCSRPSGWKG